MQQNTTAGIAVGGGLAEEQHTSTQLTLTIVLLDDLSTWINHCSVLICLVVHSNIWSSYRLIASFAKEAVYVSCVRTWWRDVHQQP